ncbi:unnamed protein product [Moneuplotes crassus]|uniref:Uncharacterized protein n=1 Tax=Euplotes crassus TaxID=5936 RepID=A0AAD2D1K8_EUPCR|nr:unnamed protein product [Moneuplotes crassus]
MSNNKIILLLVCLILVAKGSRNSQGNITGFGERNLGWGSSSYDEDCDCEENHVCEGSTMECVILPIIVFLAASLVMFTGGYGLFICCRKCGGDHQENTCDQIFICYFCWPCFIIPKLLKKCRCKREKRPIKMPKATSLATPNTPKETPNFSEINAKPQVKTTRFPKNDTKIP